MGGSNVSTHHRFRQVAIAVLFACASLLLGQARATGDTLKIHLMAGQSNMVGHARTYYEGTPNAGSS